MNRSSLNTFKRTVVAAGLGAVLLGCCTDLLWSAETNDVATASKPEQKTEKKAGKKQLTGAELYAINCNRCHPERYPTEWKSAEWKTVMLHMRVRANLPAAQAKRILKYLQEDAGN